MSRPSRRALILCSVLFLGGCDHGKPLTIEGYMLNPPTPTTAFAAGAGEQEITPYPGVPMGGHGPAGRIARGTWMRLYARAFYFQDAAGHAAALVSCDLFAVSAGLRAEVLRLVNREERLDPGALVMSATHTHHGPANFASAETYNGFGGPLPNFDKGVFDFLAIRIAHAIVDAIRDAHQHAADGHELLLYAGYATGIQRNRAIAPFYMNGPALVDEIQNASYAAGSRCPDGQGRNCPRYLSTDPTLKALEIRRGGKRRALLVFYAVHPTAMTHDDELYSPDLVGVAMRTLEREPGVVAGFFNGAEGDVSPDWDRQDRKDVSRLGWKLAVAVVGVLRSVPVRRSGDIAVATRWNRPAQRDAEWIAARFESKPTPGASEIGGAEDGRTIFYNYGFRGEARDPMKADPKLPALERPLDDLADGLELGGVKPLLGIFGVHGKPDAASFPLEFPVGRLTLGPVAEFAYVPVEATTVVGYKIRQLLGRDTIVIGLANEYFGYTATLAEYQLQQYEGGSTELGRYEADGILHLLGRVGTDRPTDVVPPQTFRPGKARKHAFGPDVLLLRVPRNMIDDDLEALLPVAQRRLESRIPRFSWQESTTGDHESARRQVSLYLRGGERVADDRASEEFLAVFQGTLQARRVYAALWIPEETPSQTAEYYFRVVTGDGQTVCSEYFTLASLQPAAPVPSLMPASRCPP